LSFCLLALAGSLTGCYVMKQAYYQGNLLSTRQQVDVLIWDKSTDKKLKENLIRAKDIIAFAETEGLAVDGAYDTYIETPRGVVAYLVFAAEPLALVQKKWWFPILGDVPYLGFYLREDRDAEAKELAAAGLDVYLSSADGFSSLGWYDDPIYSSMLKRSDAELAHLLFHELVHRTFWVAGAADFNENLAEYVAIVVTKRYLEEKGRGAELTGYLAGRADRHLFQNWVAALRGELKTLYESDTKDEAAILEKKAAVFKKFFGVGFPKFKTDAYDHLQAAKWNNAAVLAAGLYLPDDERFAKAYGCIGTPRAGEFLRLLKEAVATTKPPAKALDSLCAKG